MGKKLLVGILSATLSIFMIGCISTSNEKVAVNNPIEKKTEEEKQKDEEEYIDKISSTVVNISVDGSMKNMRTISETGELDELMIKQLDKTNTFFKCLIDDFNSFDVPKDFSSYNEDIIKYLNNAKDSLERMKSSTDKEIVKSNANDFIENNRNVSNIVDKILVYYAGC